MFDLAATSFRESLYQPHIPPLKVMPDNLLPGMPYLLSLMTGITLLFNSQQAKLVSYLLCFIDLLCSIYSSFACVLLLEKKERQL